MMNKITQLAQDVYTKIGPWASESIYQHAFNYALLNAGFKTEMERDITVEYEGMYVGTVRADIIADKQVVFELKAVGSASNSVVENAELQCKHYLRLTGIQLGYVVIFQQKAGSTVFVKEVNTKNPDPVVDVAPPSGSPKVETPSKVESPPKERKKRAPMTEEAKLLMQVKRKATLAAKMAK